MEKNRAALHAYFEVLASPTLADPVYRFRLKRYRLRKVTFEREVEPEIRLTRAGYLGAAAAWLVTFGTGLVMSVDGRKDGDAGEHRLGKRLLYASDAILGGTIGFRLLVHGRRLKPHWDSIAGSDRFTTDVIEVLAGAPVTLILGAESPPLKLAYVTDAEGTVAIPVADLRPFQKAPGVLDASLLYEGQPKAFTSFGLGAMTATGVALTIRKPEEEPARVDDQVLEIAGEAEDVAGLTGVSLSVNGQKDQGQGLDGSRRLYGFSLPVLLVPGMNVIRVRASGRSGAVEKTLHIERLVEPSKLHAVLVGVSRYAFLPPGKFASQDAKAIGSLLLSKGMVGKANLVVLTDEGATLGKVRDLLGVKLRRRVARDDDVVIYFAGHGAVERDISGSDPDGFAKYIALHDTRADALYTTGLPMDELSRLAGRLQARNVVFILDTCYSGGSGRTITAVAHPLTGEFLGRMATMKGRAVIGSSGPREISREDPSARHGIFTSALLEGLGGRADFNNDRLLTVQEIYAWTSEAVRERTQDRQTPVLNGHSDLSLPLGR